MVVCAIFSRRRSCVICSQTLAPFLCVCFCFPLNNTAQWALATRIIAENPARLTGTYGRIWHILPGQTKFYQVNGAWVTGEKRKRLETMAGRNAVRNTIGASHSESMSRSGRALPWLLRNYSRDVCCVGRAVGLEAHLPLLSTGTVLMVNCQYRYRMCLLLLNILHCMRSVMNFK